MYALLLILGLPLLAYSSQTEKTQPGTDTQVVLDDDSQKSSEDLANKYFGLIRASQATGNMPDPRKAMELQKILKQRVEAKRADAYGPYGAILLSQCAAIKNAGLQSPDCPTAISYLRLAAAENSVDSMKRLSAAYLDGICVTTSKYAAVDWLLKAAVIYLEANQRDEAYGITEQALSIVPDHQNAKALLQRLIVESTKEIPEPTRKGPPK